MPRIGYNFPRYMKLISHFKHMKSIENIYQLQPIEKFLTFHMRSENPGIKRVEIKEIHSDASYGLVPTARIKTTYYNNTTTHAVSCLQGYSNPAFTRCRMCKRIIKNGSINGLCDVCNSDMND